MAMWSVGKANSRRGITLIEMLIVVAIVGLMAGITFPAVSAGLESIRLRSASDALVSFLNGAVNRAERRQEVVELTVSIKDNALWLHSTEPGFEKKLELPAGVTIQAVLPSLPEESDAPRNFLVMPGAVPPRVGIQIANRRGARRIVRVDPMTGVPRIEVLETP